MKDGQPKTDDSREEVGIRMRLVLDVPGVKGEARAEMFEAFQSIIEQAEKDIDNEAKRIEEKFGLKRIRYPEELRPIVDRLEKAISEAPEELRELMRALSGKALDTLINDDCDCESCQSEKEETTEDNNKVFH